MPRRLGVLIYSDTSPTDLAALARQCEELGYTNFWYTDVPFARDCYVCLAAVASATSRLMIGPGVTNPYSRHPAVTAAAIATLDELSGGRALLGLGAGGPGLRQMGMAVRSPLTAMRETVVATRELLGGGTVTADGKTGTLADAVLDCHPAQPHLPVYFATHGERTTKLAGEIADGVLLANILVPEALQEYLDLLDEGLAKASRPKDAVQVSLRFEVCMAEDRDAAMHVMRRRVASRLLSQYPKWEYLDKLRIGLPQSFVEVAARGDDANLETAMAALPDDVVSRTVLVGDPAGVAEQISGLLRPEIDEITIRPHTVPGQCVGDVVRLFADSVIPRVDGWADVSAAPTS